MEPRTAAKHLTSPKLHRALPYLFLILAGLHLGLHWRGLWQRFTRFCQWNTASPVYRALSWGFAVGIVGIGLYGSFANRLGDRILMKPDLRHPRHPRRCAPLPPAALRRPRPLRGDSHDGRGMVGTTEIEKVAGKAAKNKYNKTIDIKIVIWYITSCWMKYVLLHQNDTGRIGQEGNAFGKDEKNGKNCSGRGRWKSRQENHRGSDQSGT